MSNQERVSWVSLLSTVLIGWWYFSNVLPLPADADLHFSLAGFVTRLIVFAVLIAIAGEIALRVALRLAGDPAEEGNPRDERDALIALQAARNAYGVLTVAVFVVLVQIALLEWVRRRPAPPATVLEALATGPLTPLLIAQMLLAALTLAGLTVYASRIFYYRRGF